MAKMIFSAERFRKHASKSEKDLLKKYLDMMDGNEVKFDGEYGTEGI